MKVFARLFCLLILTTSTVRAEFVTVPLNSVANRELTDSVERAGWTGQGKDNCLTGFPRGQQTFKGVPFAIIANGPAAVILGGKNLPALPEAVNLTVPKIKGKFLYLLATYTWNGDGVVAMVNIQYESGESQSIPLTWGDRISGWWGPRELERGTVAWHGQNGQGSTIGVYLIPLKLTQPDKAVRSVTFKSTFTGGSLAVLGVSFGDKPAEELVQGQLTWKPVAAGVENWFPLKFNYDRDTVAAWEKGFVKSRTGWLHADGERLLFDDNQAVRFQGVVLGGASLYPPKSLAEHYIRRLTKFGFNQVRFHSLMDTFQSDRTDPHKLDLKRLDKFDYFINELQKAGISIKASMLFSHLWTEAAGVTQADKIAGLNNTQYFYDERHQELYLTFLREFLAHKNPYTGRTYAEEPAFNMFKVVNECSLFFYTTDSVPSSYRLKLQELWNLWLKKKYGDDSGLQTAWRVANETSPIDLNTESLSKESVALRNIGSLASIRPAEVNRAADQTKFYYELEVNWFSKVRDVLRSTGNRTLLQGSSWGGPNYLQEIQTAANANFDFAGKHSYWLHPLGGWVPNAVTFENLPIEKSPKDNFFMFIYQQPAGKPFTCTEWQFPWPNDYTVEAGPFMAAYGALQNLSANHHFVVDDVDSAGFLNSIFGMFDNPAQMACEPLAHYLYVRGDVKPAPLIYRNALDENELHNPLRKRTLQSRESDTRFAMLFGGTPCPPEAAFIGRVELSFDPKKYPAVWDEKTYQKCHDEKAKTITSSTGELIWNYDQGWIRINTPKTQGVMGFLSNQTFQDGGLTATLNDAYGVVHFSSLDSRPVNKSHSIHIALVGRTRNTGQQYGKRGDLYRLDKQGDSPILMEPVTADFTLKTGAKIWHLTPLNFNGDPLTNQVATLETEHGILKAHLSNKEAGTVHFLLEAAPGHSFLGLGD